MPSTRQDAPPVRSIDDRGRAIPLTDAEARARAEAAIQGLRAMAAIGDPDEQDRTFEALSAGLNASRMSPRERLR